MKKIILMFVFILTTSIANARTSIEFLCIEDYEYIKITDSSRYGFEIIPSPFQIDGVQRLYECHLNDYNEGVEKFGKKQWEQIYAKAGYTENPYDVIDKYGWEVWEELDDLRMQGFCLTDEEKQAFLDSKKPIKE